MYSPDRQKIFDDIEANDECDTASCPSYRCTDNRRNSSPVCMATAHGECNRVNKIASEVNQFIADNDDVFIYIKPVNEN